MPCSRLTVAFEDPTLLPYVDWDEVALQTRIYINLNELIGTIRYKIHHHHKHETKNNAGGRKTDRQTEEDNDYLASQVKNLTPSIIIMTFETEAKPSHHLHVKDTFTM